MISLSQFFQEASSCRERKGSSVSGSNLMKPSGVCVWRCSFSFFWKKIRNSEAALPLPGKEPSYTEVAMRATLQYLSKHIDWTIYKFPKFFCIFSDLLWKCREKLPNALLDFKDGIGGRTSACGEKPMDPNVTLWWRFRHLFLQLCEMLQQGSSLIPRFRVSWSSPPNPEGRYRSITDVMGGQWTDACAWRAEPAAAHVNQTPDGQSSLLRCKI